MDARASILSALIGGDNETYDAFLSAMRHGQQPYTPGRDVPQDVGLGGPSTEYLAGGQDPNGTEFNYPQIWWMNGKPSLLEPEAAYRQSLRWEAANGLMFPRYRNAGGADFAAQNRSARGGASDRQLAGLFGYGNF